MPAASPSWRPSASQFCKALVWRISSRGMPAITMISAPVSWWNFYTSLNSTTAFRSGCLATICCLKA